MTAQELKQGREKLCLTQQQLGERVGWEGKYANQRVYDYEAGRRKMSAAVGTIFRLIFEGKM